MYTSGSHSSFIHESTAPKIAPLRQVQTATKPPQTEQKKPKLLPRRLSEFEKELEEAKNEPLDLSIDELDDSLEDFDERLNIEEDEHTKPSLPTIAEEGQDVNPARFVMPFATPKNYSTPYKSVVPTPQSSTRKNMYENKENRVQASVSLVNSAKKSKAVNCVFSTPKSYYPPPDVKRSALSSLNGNRTLTVKGVTYVILKELGKGGSSVVYDCYDPITGNNRAVKQVSLENKISAVGFLNEVKMLEKLQNCPNIIKMYDYEELESKQQLLVVLEKGITDLSKVIKQLTTKELPLHKLMYYWMEMLYAVQQIHRHGIVHCDLKPSNFVMGQEGTIKLIDFGISCSIQNDMTSAIKTVAEGSLNYISPESIGNSSSNNPESPSFGKPKYKVNFKSDVWSLGCILYQLVYKRTPFHHINHMYAKVAVILDPNHKIEYRNIPTVSSKLINTIKKCLVHNPKSRPSINELIQEYETCFFN